MNQNIHIKDLDIDDNASHVEGSTTVMSAGETESDSDEQIEMEIENPETPYVQENEHEFGVVSLFKFNKY